MATYHSTQYGDCRLDVNAIYNHHPDYEGFTVKWSCARIGFGQCSFFYENEEEPVIDIFGREIGDYSMPYTKRIKVDTENMAVKNDKEFLRALFEALIEKMEIIG